MPDASVLLNATFSSSEPVRTESNPPKSKVEAMNFLKRVFKNNPSTSTRSKSSASLSNGDAGEPDDSTSISSAVGVGDGEGGGGGGGGTLPRHEGRRTRSKSTSRNSTPTGSQTSLPGVVMRVPPPTIRTREVRMSSSKHLALILPGLLLGSQEIATDLHGLQHQNVTHILNVTIEVPEKFPEKFIYHRIAISDLPSTKIVQYFDEAFAFIDRARSQGGVALVHCYYGNSRSASFIIAYLIKVEHMRYTDALDYLRILRPDVNPNDGFRRQLKEYEQSFLR